MLGLKLFRRALAREIRGPIALPPGHQGPPPRLEQSRAIAMIETSGGKTRQVFVVGFDTVGDGSAVVR